MRRVLLPAGVLMAGLLAWLGNTAVRHWGEVPPQAPRTIRAAWSLPGGVTPGSGPESSFGLTVSPDGRLVAFAGITSGESMLYVSALDRGVTRELPGTSGASFPFWSPDGVRLGYFAAGRLRTIEVRSGVTRDLANAPAPRGGAFTTDGSIVFAPDVGGGLALLRPNGSMRPLTNVVTDAGETSHRFPVMTPDGRVVFFVRASAPSREGIWIVPLDASTSPIRLVGSKTQGIVVGRHLVYASEEALVAQPLSSVSSGARPIVIGVPAGSSDEHELFAAAGGDVLIFGPPVTLLRELQWRDRTGALATVAGAPRFLWDVRASPDGRRIAATETDPQTSTLDVFVYDGTRPVPIRLSTSLQPDESPVWSPDGRRLAWITGRTGVVTRGAQGVLEEQPRHTFEGPARLSQWTRDGRWIVASVRAPGAREDLWLVPADAGAPVPYARSAFAEIQGTVSPDGRWMAYASDESGVFEIYADRFPAPGARTRITAGGGTDPRWAGDGRLVFRRGQEFHAVVVAPATGGRLEAVSTSRLFDAGVDVRAYDTTPDASRFLLVVAAAGHAAGRFTLVVNPLSNDE